MEKQENEAKGIVMPSREEIKAAIEKNNRLLSWALSLEPDQINYLCDGGWYNYAIKGYLIRAGCNAGLGQDQIHDLLGGLRFALDEMNMEEAEQTYMDFP